MKAQTKNGFITLLATLIVGAIGLSVAISLLMLGLGSSRNSLLILQSGQARMMANACTEQALENIVLSPSYSGTGALTIDGNSCTFAVTNSGATFSIDAVGEVGRLTKRVSVTKDSNGINWQEVP